MYRRKYIWFWFWMCKYEKLIDFEIQQNINKGIPLLILIRNFLGSECLISNKVENIFFLNKGIPLLLLTRDSLGQIPKKNFIMHINKRSPK